MKTLRFFMCAFAGVMSLASTASAADKGGTMANFSGHMRTRFEMTDNDNASKTKWGEQFLNRARLNMDLMPMDSLKVRIAPQATWQWSDPSTNVSALNLYEGWMSWMPSDSITLWVGRQEIVYGKQRIFGDGNWSQAGVTHDSARVRFSYDMGSSDLFWVKIDENHFNAAGSIDATRATDTDLLALYNSFNLSETTGFLNTADVYLTLLWNQGSAVKTNYFMGGILLDGGMNAIDYNLEVAAQMGKFANVKSQKGLLAALDVGYTFMEKHRVGFEGVYANNEYRALTGTEHEHLGHSDLVNFGPNLLAMGLKTDFKLTDEFDVGVDGWMFMKAKKKLGNPSSLGDRTAGKKQVGMELDMTLGYNAEDNLRFEAGYNLFMPRGSTKLSGASANQSDVYLQGTLKF